MTRWLWAAAGGVAIVAVAILQTYRLGDSPAYLNLDEAHFANHAYSLATSGRDLNGNRMPLFISLEDPLGDRPTLAWGTTWYHPVGFYAIASVLTLAPLSEWSIRLPIALIGVLNLVLVFLVARKWSGTRTTALAAAALLAMTPAHFILSRMALDYLLPVPFTLGWLLALGHLRASPASRSAVAAGLVLGVGCFSYVSSWLVMPVYLAVTAVVLRSELRRSDLLAPLTGAFCVPLLAWLPWIFLHPEMPGNLLAQYQAGETRRSLLSAVATGTDLTGAVKTTVAAYWSYFDPSFLFIAGGSSRLVSTGASGVWSLGGGVLLVMALIRAVTRLGVAERILLGGLLLAPIPAAHTGEPFAIQRAITMLPVGVLLAVLALDGLKSRTRLQQALVVIALVAVPVQFTGFVDDYFSGYRVRAAAVIDPTAFRDTARVLSDLLERRQPPALAVTAPLYDASAKWRFYATSSGHPEGWARTRYFSGRLEEIAALPTGALAVVESATLTSHAGWQVVASPMSLFGKSPLTILEKQ
ncbi:MAG: glycosyltransferase family 39 protein [Acidimicrobiia bacterium]